MAKWRSRQQKLNKIYRDMALEREQCCSGCGRYDVHLSHSHIVPRSHNTSLITDPNNITYHCLSIGEHTGCHDIWEHGELRDKKHLLDFENNMKYIRDNDILYYNKLIYKN